MITPCDRIYTAGNAMHGQLAMGARQLDLYVEDLYDEITMRTTVNSRRRSRKRILGKRSSRRLMRRREKGGSSRLELGLIARCIIGLGEMRVLYLRSPQFNSIS